MKSFPIMDTAARASSAFQKSFVQLATLSLIPMVVLLVGLYLAGFRDYSMNAINGDNLYVGLMYLAAILVFPAMVSIIKKTDKGEDADMGLSQALSMGMTFLLPLLVTWVLAGIIIGIGLLALIIPGIIAAVFLSLVGQSIVLGDKKYIDALKDSFNLVRGRAWSLLAYLLFGLIIFGVIQWLVMFAASFLPGLLTLTVYAIMTGLSFAFQTSLTTLAYLEMAESNAGAQEQPEL